MSRLLGGFSRAFDLISAEYGWVDETILDLAVARLRQVSAAIGERLRFERVREHELVEWQTRQIAMFVAATVQVGKGKQNKLLGQASELRLPGLEEELQALGLVRSEELEPAPSEGEVAALDEYERRALQRNRPGSFEMLTTGMRPR